MIITYNKGFSLANPNFKKLTGYLIANLNTNHHCPTRICFDIFNVLLDSDQKGVKSELSTKEGSYDLDLNKLYLVGVNGDNNIIGINKYDGVTYEINRSTGVGSVVGDSFKEFGEKNLTEIRHKVDKNDLQNAKIFLAKLHLFI